jgi:hypothetical protein
VLSADSHPVTMNLEVVFFSAAFDRTSFDVLSVQVYFELVSAQFHLQSLSNHLSPGIGYTASTLDPSRNLGLSG